MKTLLNNLWAYIGHEDDGHLLHTDKRTGTQRVSLQSWPSCERQESIGRRAWQKWEELKDPPPAAA